MAGFVDVFLANAQTGLLSIVGISDFLSDPCVHCMCESGWDWLDQVESADLLQN